MVKAIGWRGALGVLPGLLGMVIGALPARAEDRPTIGEVDRLVEVASEEGLARTSWQPVQAAGAAPVVGWCAPPRPCKRWGVSLTLAMWASGFQGDTTFNGNDYTLDTTPRDVLENFGDIVSAALEQPADDVRLPDLPTPIQQAAEQGVEPVGRAQDQVVAVLDLVDVPRVREALTTRRRGEQADAAIDPAVAERFDGLWRQGGTSLLEHLGVVHLHEEVVARLKADAAVA